MQIFTTLLLALAPSLGMALPDGEELVLSRPTVLVLFTPDSEMDESERNTQDFQDFIDDFLVYQSSLADALKDNLQVQFKTSTAGRVQLEGAETITRAELGGFGVIVFVPGQEPVVFDGVATDADVLCGLHRQLPGAVEVSGCD